MYRYSRFSSFASRVARTLGHPATFMLFLGAALLWLATGPLFHFSSNWYGAYSNTATIVTTLLLFIIQHTQSREIASIQFKLNEIIRVSEGAHNALLDIEEMTDRDYDRIKASYTTLARQAREQLQNGKLKWATARVSMESLDSFFSPSASEEEDEEAAGETANASAESAEATILRRQRVYTARLASSLDRMTRVAAHSGHAPMSLVAVGDWKELRVERRSGFGEQADTAGMGEWTPLGQFLVAQVGAVGQAFVVEDTAKNPLPPDAVGGMVVAALLAVPLIGARKRSMGCLAVLDTHPHVWRSEEIAALHDLAALTVDQVSEQARQRPAPPVPQTTVGTAVEALFSNTSPAAMVQPEMSAEKAKKDESALPQNTVVVNAITPEIPVEASGADTPAPGTILVADDSSTNRDLLQRRLEREGYRILTAGNGHEALDCLQTETVGLLLLDVMMPEMDGEEVLQHMQADARMKSIPVIMVTALDEQDSVRRCLEAGAKDYILKPLDPAQLRERVHAYLPPPIRPAQKVQEASK